MQYPLHAQYAVMGNWPGQQFPLNHDGLRASKNTLAAQCGFTYSPDARTKDARGLQTILDAPSRVGWDGTPSETCTIPNQHYGGFYKNYPHIGAGQITYYVDPSTAQPFINPVYALSSVVEKVEFVDPMGGHKMYYRKTPATLPTTNGLDQETIDSVYHREDLMSRQQDLSNRSKWTPRFIN